MSGLFVSLSFMSFKVAKDVVQVKDIANTLIISCYLTSCECT